MGPVQLLASLNPLHLNRRANQNGCRSKSIYQPQLYYTRYNQSVPRLNLKAISVWWVFSNQ